MIAPPGNGSCPRPRSRVNLSPINSTLDRILRSVTAGHEGDLQEDEWPPRNRHSRKNSSRALEQFGINLTDRATAGQARPRDRAGQRDPPREPGAHPAHQEQPGADRRTRRRQDRRRRGPRPAHRRRRRGRVAQGQGAHLPRHLRPRRRRHVPRPVRGAAEERAQGDHRVRRAHHHVHRRAARAHGRRRGRGIRRRLEHAQAHARPRRAAPDRRHHAQRVPRVHREGCGARAPVPAGVRRRAERRGHRRDPARAQGALRGAPRSDHQRLRTGRRPPPCRTVTCPAVSCRTRRST